MLGYIPEQYLVVYDHPRSESVYRFAPSIRDDAVRIADTLAEAMRVSGP